MLKKLAEDSSPKHMSLRKMEAPTEGPGKGKPSENMGLLDSGSTHPLRQAKNESELGQTRTVSVTLADGTQTMLKQSEKGTILSEGKASPILPVGALVEQLGYKFNWTARGCRLSHPTKPDVVVKTRSRCPEVRECDAPRLIRELEAAKLRELEESTKALQAAVDNAEGHE